MRISIVNRRVHLWILCMSVCSRSCWTLVDVAMWFSRGWQAVVSCSKYMVDTGKRPLLVSGEKLGETIDKHLVFVFNLQTGLATAMIEAQILEVFPHVHVDAVVMRSGEGGGSTKPLERQSNTIVVRGRDVLDGVGVGVMVRSDRRAQTNSKEANQKSKDRRTTDVKSEHKSSPVESEWIEEKEDKTTG
jgi:hypothetical protein